MDFRVDAEHVQYVPYTNTKFKNLLKHVFNNSKQLKTMIASF